MDCAIGYATRIGQDRQVQRVPQGKPNTIRKISVAGFVALGVLWVIAWFFAPPKHPNVPFNGGGAVLWKATGYCMDDGWGINLEGHGTPIQIYLGTSADLEVDSGYLSSGGHVAFLPPGTAPTFQNCLSASGAASSQAEPLTAITPGQHADLCSSCSGGDIAYMHVTRNDQSGLTMNITIWRYTP